ncbi:hypothetical protein EV421DRAFT_1988981 [Armillaria borealis]|uniref:Uncharacterized protein n=1 Tax=Armillaria borealis TaxID=47425 RepID=A0AA39J3U6_9AGAR|nr:hypothetical protein EV421DRAFT_1988981 [Armillaria borealis]
MTKRLRYLGNFGRIHKDRNKGVTTDVVNRIGYEKNSVAYDARFSFNTPPDSRAQSPTRQGHDDGHFVKTSAGCQGATVGGEFHPAKTTSTSAAEGRANGPSRGWSGSAKTRSRRKTDLGHRALSSRQEVGSNGSAIWALGERYGTRGEILVNTHPQEVVFTFNVSPNSDFLRLALSALEDGPYESTSIVAAAFGPSHVHESVPQLLCQRSSVIPVRLRWVGRSEGDIGELALPEPKQAQRKGPPVGWCLEQRIFSDEDNCTQKVAIANFKYSGSECLLKSPLSGVGDSDMVQIAALIVGGTTFELGFGVFGSTKGGQSDRQGIERLVKTHSDIPGAAMTVVNMRVMHSYIQDGSSSALSLDWGTIIEHGNQSEPIACKAAMGLLAHHIFRNPNIYSALGGRVQGFQLKEKMQWCGRSPYK